MRAATQHETTSYGYAPTLRRDARHDPAQIDERNTYAVRATITEGETLLCTSAERYAVITGGSPTSGVRVQVVGGCGSGAGSTGSGSGARRRCRALTRRALARCWR